MSDTLADTKNAWYASQLGHSGAVIELEREYFGAANNESWADVALRFYASANGSNPAGSLTDETYKYYSNLSGLTPKESYSLADHMSVVFGASGSGHSITPPITDQLEAFFDAGAIDGYSSDARVSKNLVTYQQATIEGISGALASVHFQVQSANATLAVSTAQKVSGDSSMSMTSSGAGGAMSLSIFPVVLASRVPVVGGRSYTLQWKSRANTTVRSCSVTVYWYDSAGGALSNQSGGTATNTNTGWTLISGTFVAPPTAAYCLPHFSVSGALVVGEVHYLDELGMWEGTSTDWVMPGKLHNVNLLTYDQATFENSLGGYVLIGGSPTFVRSTAASASGSASGLLTLTTATGSSYGTPSIPVVAGRTYTAHAKIREASGTGLSARVYLGWYNSSDVNISLTDFGGITTTAAFQVVTKTAVAPVGAAYARVITWLTGAIGNATYTDEVGLWEGYQTTWVPPYRTSRPADGDGVDFWRDISGKNRHAIQNTAANQPKFRKYDVTASKNLLTYNQATLENGVTTGWSFSAITGSVVTTPTPASGIYSLSCVATATSGAYARTGAGALGTPITGGRVHTAQAKVKAKAGNTGFSVDILFAYYDAAGVYAGSQYFSSVVVANTTTWSPVTVSGLAPTNAAFVTTHLRHASTFIVGDTFYWDEIGVWEGTSTDWVAPGLPVRNLLTYNQATVETDTTGLVNRDGFPTIARSTAQASHGIASLLVTATAAANSAFGTTIPPDGGASVFAGTTYTAFLKARAVGTARGGRIYLIWYNSVGTQLGIDSYSTTVTSSAWISLSITAVAPTNATYAVLAGMILSPIIGDAFYFDEMGIWEGSSTTWQPPVTLPSNKPTVQFDGLNDALSGVMGAIDLANVSIYAVVNQDFQPAATNRRIFQVTGGGTFFLYSSPPSGAMAASFGSSAPSSPTIGVTNYHVISSIARAIESQSYTDGVAGSLVTTDPAGTSGTVLEIGHTGGAGIHAGCIAAILIYSGAHTVAQRQQIERWLGGRFGVTVA